MQRNVLVLEACVVDMERRTVRRSDGGEETLTEQEQGLLGYLAERPGRTVPRDELLERVWGYSTNVVTRAIDVAVRRLRQKIEADASNPTHVIAVRGVGYRFEASDLAPEPGQGASSSLVPHERSSFVGRAPELRRLEELLRGDHRIVTITGPPGCGKSRLALRACSRLRAEGVPVAYVALDRARTGHDLLARVAGALSVPLDPGHDEDGGIAQLALALRARGPVLLLMDDAEHLVEPLAHAASAWLQQTGSARLLVTSRERVRVRGEAVVALQPLPLDEAVALFLERARAVCEGWGASDEEAVRTLVERLDCNPLAIELAAARVEVLSPRALLEALDQRFRLLGAPDRDAGDRQATLERAIAWSWSLLSDWERAALAQCSVFEGGFSVASAGEVLDLAHPDAPWVLDQVQALVGRSLVQASPTATGQVRFRVPESIRLFAQAHGDPVDLRAARERHRAHLLELGESFAEKIHGPEGSVYLKLLQLEADNLRAAFRDAVDSDAEVAARIALALDVVYAIGGSAAERIAILDQALASKPGIVLEARLLIARSRPKLLSGDPKGAMADGHRAKDLARTSGDDELRRRVLLALGEVHAEAADLAGARTFATLCAEQSREAGDTWFEGRSLRLLTAIAFADRDLDTQAVYLERLEQLVGDRASGDPMLGANVRHLMGRHATAREQHQLAIARYREAIRMAEAVGDLRRASLAESDLACELCLAGDLAGALEHFENTLRLHRSMGHRRSAIAAAGNAGQILLLLGRTEEALDHLDQAVADARVQGTAEALAPRLASRGLARLVDGRTALALEDLQAGLDAYAAVGRAHSHAHYSAYAALAAALLGDAGAARAHAEHTEPLAGRGPMDVFPWIARGAVALASGDPKAAAEAADRAASSSSAGGQFLGSRSWEFIVPEELVLAVHLLRRAL